MNLKELRVGNLVMHEDGGIFEIENVSEYAVNGMGWSDTHYGVQSGGFDWGPSADEVFGIPLTEEWLIKMGVIFCEDNDGRKGFVLKFGGIELVGMIGGVACVRDALGICHKKIEYVHQFQNLYFNLEGKELIINE